MLLLMVLFCQIISDFSGHKVRVGGSPEGLFIPLGPFPNIYYPDFDVAMGTYLFSKHFLTLH